MKKQITLLCECGKFGILVEELSVFKVCKQVVTDLEKVGPEGFICLGNYIKKEASLPLYIKARTVGAIVVMEKSNIQVPNQSLFLPGAPGRPN